MLNRLQAALLEHDFVVQYKHGTTMPAEYLSCLPAFQVEKMDPIAAFDPLQPNLKELPTSRSGSPSHFYVP